MKLDWKYLTIAITKNYIKGHSKYQIDKYGNIKLYYQTLDLRDNAFQLIYKFEIPDQIIFMSQQSGMFILQLIKQKKIKKPKSKKQIEQQKEPQIQYINLVQLLRRR